MFGTSTAVVYVIRIYEALVGEKASRQLIRDLEFAEYTPEKKG